MGMMSESEFARKVREIRSNKEKLSLDDYARLREEFMKTILWCHNPSKNDFDHLRNNDQRESTLWEQFTWDNMVKEEWTTFVDGKESKTIDIYYILGGTTITRDNDKWTATRKIQVSPQYNPGKKHTIEMQCINGIYIEPITKYPKH